MDGTVSNHKPCAGYRGYADLASAQTEGVHYSVAVHRRPRSSVAVIAPHGGGIEIFTSDVARAIAGEEFNLYMLEGIRPAHNYVNLHLTSHRFDEPRCLELVSACDHVIAIHGCAGDDHPQAFVGGRDLRLKETLADSLSDAGIDVHTTGHRFPGLHADNICNRGRRGAGVQIEMTTALRRGPRVALASSVRAMLLSLDGR